MNYANITTNSSQYCGIHIVRGGSIFVDFVGYPYPRINLPTNV